MKVELVEVLSADDEALGNLAQFYQYDFTEFTPENVGADGRFRFMDTSWIFSKPEHHVYLIKVGEQLAGFAAVYRDDAFRDPNEIVWYMAEFFVMRTYRGRGVGESAATQLFDRFGGTWEIAQVRTNTPAQAFWRAVVGRHTSGDFEEIDLDDDRWRGPVQYFRTR